jgi:hypothetical protein
MSVTKMLTGLVVLAIAALAYYGISPIFMHQRASDPVPQAEVGIVPSTGSGASLVGTVGHPASGMARIVSTDGQSYLRYEDFSTLNGPDLYVYLSKDLHAKEFVNLGKLKATEGDVNYEIPAGTNPSDYRYALIWCKAFGVLFNSADLSSQ